MQRDDDALLVTIESLDGAGGTTVSREMQRQLGGYLTAEPSDLWTGRQLDRCLESETHPLTDLHYFIADRVHHIYEEVDEALQSNELVVSDRWSDSTRAYQPVLLKDEFACLDEARDYVRESLRPVGYRPDLTLWIDTHPQTCLERIDNPDKHEQLDTQVLVRDEYKRLERNHSRIKQVDGNRDVDEIVDACLNIIDIYLEEQ